MKFMHFLDGPRAFEVQMDNYPAKSFPPHWAVQKMSRRESSSSISLADIGFPARTIRFVYELVRVVEQTSPDIRHGYYKLEPHSQEAYEVYLHDKQRYENYDVYRRKEKEGWL